MAASTLIDQPDFPMNLHIRAAEADDVPRLRRLLIETVKTHCSDDYDARQIAAWVSSAENPEPWARFLNEQVALVAECDGELAGFTSLAEGDFVYFLYVHSDFMGQGVGRQLLQTLIDVARTNGVSELYSHVSKTALGFFRRHGFERICDNHNLINGVEIVNHQMRAHLA